MPLQHPLSTLMPLQRPQSNRMPAQKPQAERGLVSDRGRGRHRVFQRPARRGAAFLAVGLLLLAAFLAGPVKAQTTVRFATFNVAMGLEKEGELAERLESGDDEGLQKFAAILQLKRPDVLLINEFDYQEGVDAAALFNDNYLAVSQRGEDPIDYPYSFRAPVNTGVDSGEDLDGDGQTGGPGDALGYGAFPGQYGMLVLSRYPIDEDGVRTFRRFLWSDMPGALRPYRNRREPFWSDDIWYTLPLSSKSHWDVPIQVDRFHVVRFLASHPTPPVFDGDEDRNGRRNHDETRFWVDYTSQGDGRYIYDDNGRQGGVERGKVWVLAGDLNSDPSDGDSIDAAIEELVTSNTANRSCIPSSAGALEASRRQGGENARHRGNPRFDTSDFNDETPGNLRVDYLLTARRTDVTGCGVFWPASDEPHADLVDFSDHRLVWMDVEL